VTEIADNWRRIGDRVAVAARRSGREPASVTVIAVSKTKPAAMIEAAIQAGARHIGENYVQEAATKKPQVQAPATWHFIGHLQRNKVAKAVELFDVVHTVESLTLAHALDRRARQQQRRLRVLVEVNLGGEASKGGVAVEAVEALLIELASCASLQVDGLMAIPPPASSSQEVRPYFRMLRELRDRLRTTTPNGESLRELSMGMTDDFEVAIEEGATMVRIGRAIFGSR